MDQNIVKTITQSILDCECKGNGYVFLKNGKDVKCPIHYECSSSEEYRLTLLRIEYQNMRNFILDAIQQNSEYQDLSFPTTPQELDNRIRETYEVYNPDSWVRAIQHYARELILNS